MPTPEGEQRNSFVRELLGNFSFALQRGLAAAASAPRGRSGQAALAGALGAPQAQAELERQRQAEEFDRQLRLEAANRQQSQLDLQQAQLDQRIAEEEAASRRAQISGNLVAFGAMEGAPARAITAPAPVSQFLDPGGMQGEGLGQLLPPQMSQGTQRVPLANPALEIAEGLTARPPTAEEQRIAKAQDVFSEEQARLLARAEFPTEDTNLTPEEHFIKLAIEDAKPQTPTEEQEVRANARSEWADLSRDPELSAITLEIRELQRRAALQSLEGPGTLTPQQMGVAVQLGNAIRSNPEYLDMVEIQIGMTGVEVGLSQGNGFGDITAINAFQRMVDPGATVREGDVTLLQSASAFVDRVLSRYPIERLREGDQLPEATRQQMLTTARSLYEVRARNYNTGTGRRFKSLAAGGGVPFSLVGQDFASTSTSIEDDLSNLNIQ